MNARTAGAALFAVGLVTGALVFDAVNSEADAAPKAVTVQLEDSTLSRPSELCISDLADGGYRYEMSFRPAFADGGAAILPGGNFCACEGPLSKAQITTCIAACRAAKGVQ